MKINAAVLFEVNSPFQMMTLDLAPPQAGEVLVKLAAAGVCHSDWHLVTGATRHPLPVVAGHEGAGEITAVGPGVSPASSLAITWHSTGRPFAANVFTA